MALLDLQAMQTPAPETAAGGSSNSGQSCGSDLSVVACHGHGSELSVALCS
jgi:hypothetical protein